MNRSTIFKDPYKFREKDKTKRLQRIPAKQELCDDSKDGMCGEK